LKIPNDRGLAIVSLRKPVCRVYISGHNFLKISDGLAMVERGFLKCLSRRFLGMKELFNFSGIGTA
jgi:hypothetical protein